MLIIIEAGWWVHGGYYTVVSTFECLKFSIIKRFLKSINALMWSFMESFDIKKGVLCGKLFTIHCWVKESSYEAIRKDDFNLFSLKKWVWVCVCLEKSLPFRPSWRDEWWLPFGRRNKAIFIFFLFIYVSNEHIVLLLSTSNVIFQNFIIFLGSKRLGGAHLSPLLLNEFRQYQALRSCHGGPPCAGS